MTFDRSIVKAPTSRRDLILMTGAATIAGGLPNVALAAQPAVATEGVAGFARKRLAQNDVPLSSALSFTEHRIPHDGHMIYARDYKGAGPAFVLMHGFPDNLHIYDDLVPYLVGGGRRVVAFDFLGFGASDKSPGAIYSFKQQLGDLESVVAALGLGKVVPVAHDSSGPAGINFTLAHPEQVESLCILNSGYDDRLPVHWPEMVALFATKSLNPLSGAIAQSPEQFGWLLAWQRKQFRDTLPQSEQPRFDTVMGPLIADNFIQQPSSGPAFAQLASQFFEELARNSKRLPELGMLDMPVTVIWGEFDPYITKEVGKDRASHFKHASLHVLPAGHWLQSDLPEQVAKVMLS
jgi:haloalkane dehalogenase